MKSMTCKQNLINSMDIMKFFLAAKLFNYREVFLVPIVVRSLEVGFGEGRGKTTFILTYVLAIEIL